MTHQEVQQNEIIERYVRHQLTPEERLAFQEHYFACKECFEQVQTMARFVAGVHQAARQGLLADGTAEPWWANLFKPAFVFAATTAVLLALGFGWLLLKQSSAPEQKLAIQQTPTATPQSATSPETTAIPTISDSPKSPPDLLAQNRPPQTPDAAPGKSPIVFLSSERGDSGGNQLTIPANTETAILRIDVEPGSTLSGFQFQVFDSAKHLVTSTISGKASAKGTVSARLSTKLLQTGKYVVKCYGLRDGQRELVGEYKLQVLKP